MTVKEYNYLAFKTKYKSTIQKWLKQYLAAVKLNGKML